jgi:hypothetical protein
LSNKTTTSSEFDRVDNASGGGGKPLAVAAIDRYTSYTPDLFKIPVAMATTTTTTTTAEGQNQKEDSFNSKMSIRY